MLVQEYLKSNGIDALKAEFSINVAYHPTLPLVVLNYDQIDSPKTHPIVRECRGLVLCTEDWSLVARSFPRFFNWGEVQDEAASFDWNSVSVQEKVDGSLVLIYNWRGEWFANTRGSFGLSPIMNSEYDAKFHGVELYLTWGQAFLKALKVDRLSDLNLDPALTYVCEFCSPWNKVVRTYTTPTMFLLTTFKGEEELGSLSCTYFEQVNRYDLRTASQIECFLLTHPEATFEGVVVKDKSGNRWKIKNARYVSLHRMKGNNGEQLYKPANLIPYILANEGDELLTYFPEVAVCYAEYKAKVDAAFEQLLALWRETWQIPNQKDFALSIVGKTPFTAILFSYRKEKEQTEEGLRKLWRSSADGIVKQLFKS